MRPPNAHLNRVRVPAIPRHCATIGANPATPTSLSYAAGAFSAPTNSTALCFGDRHPNPRQSWHACGPWCGCRFASGANINSLMGCAFRAGFAASQTSQFRKFQMRSSHCALLRGIHYKKITTENGIKMLSSAMLDPSEPPPRVCRRFQRLPTP